MSVRNEIKYGPKSKRQRPNSKRDFKKPYKAIFSKPQKTINSRQHSQFSQDVCCSHHRRSCAFNELFKLTSPLARSRVSANIKIVKKVVQWTSLVILLIVTASFCPVLCRVTRDNDSENDSIKIESFQWFMREEFLFGDHWSFWRGSVIIYVALRSFRSYAQKMHIFSNRITFS